jgi:periplasmic divalent cation tolerance protein
MPTVYVTAPPEEASDIAEMLVEERLAACVNRFPCTSVYRWEGEVHRDDEVVLLAKTTEEAYDRLEMRVEELHPDDVPCIERFEESDALDSFAAWRDEAISDEEVEDEKGSDEEVA